MLECFIKQEHYDTILPGVQNCSYYCHYCDVGYRNVEDHRTACPYRCTFCLADTTCAPVHLCTACYQRHLKPFTSSTCVSLIEFVSTVMVCPSTNPIHIAKPWDPVDSYSEVLTRGKSSRRVISDAVSSHFELSGHTACFTPNVIMNETKILSMQALDLKFLGSYNYYLLPCLKCLPPLV